VAWTVKSYTLHLMTTLPDCLYCRKDKRLQDLMIEIAPLAFSTLYLFKEQSHPGRCVVAYRAHVNELFELDDAELVGFTRDVATAARAIKAAFNPNKINYGAYSDKLPHLHMHLVPKYQGGVSWGAPFEMMPADKKLLTETDYTAMIALINAKL
jgi:diadenosine tetraphosphate (Ap4A) HIT family hydrolase